MHLRTLPFPSSPPTPHPHPTQPQQENNYKTYRALHGTDKGNNCDDDDDDTKMAVEEDGGGNKSRIKALVEEVCALDSFKDKRAAKMDLDDFLALLAEFNKRGVHFTS